jgi:RNA polymerase sigma-70 factor (ECF subfamily)
METTLLQRAREFDREALAEIYDKYSPEIFRYAYRLTGSSQEAEECLSETFTRLLQALYHGRGPKDYLRAYLYRTAHNWITDQYRRQAPPSLSLDTEHVPHDQPSSTQPVDEKLERERVRAALRLLTPDQRQVIVMRFLEGWSNEEIAQVLDKPVGAVKALQHRAIGTLRKLLVQKEEE